jgi:GT2 family glycosyltransferase
MTAPDISICIVNLNAKDYLKNCLESIPKAANNLTWEIILVDNGSTDGSVSMIGEEFPHAVLIPNSENLGYTRPMNQALQNAKGRYLIQLNPDTIPKANAFLHLFNFMESNPSAGICTPKVLNRDGSIQYQCRRSAARPWDTITYFSGLSRLFPKSPFFAKYLMTYLPDDEIAEVEAVSGSCMFIRREVINQIGYLDEQFFAYQEDADFCFRARKAGWKIFYVPSAEIIHFGGQGGSKAQPYRAIYEWHRSYYLYYRKHLARDYLFLINWLMYLAMGVKLTVSLMRAFVSSNKIVGTPKP